MIPAKVNFTIYQNTTFKRRLRFDTLDLTGCSAKMQLRDSIGGVLFETLNNDDGEAVVTGGTPSYIDLSLAPVVTADLDENAVYDLILTFPNGEVFRIIEGKITMSLGVTEL